MGLFDTVKIDVPIPGHEIPHSGFVFQTKDFDCTMDQYGIDGNRDLYKVFTNNEGESIRLYLTIYNGEIRLSCILPNEHIETETEWVMYDYFIVIKNGKMESARQEKVVYPRVNTKESL